MTEKDTLLTRRQCAEMLTLKPQTLAYWECSDPGKLPVTRVGSKKVCYRLSDVREFLRRSNQR